MSAAGAARANVCVARSEVARGGHSTRVTDITIMIGCSLLAIVCAQTTSANPIEEKQHELSRRIEARRRRHFHTAFGVRHHRRTASRHRKNSRRHSLLNERNGWRVTARCGENSRNSSVKFVATSSR